MWKLFQKLCFPSSAYTSLKGNYQPQYPLPVCIQDTWLLCKKISIPNASSNTTFEAEFIGVKSPWSMDSGYYLIYLQDSFPVGLLYRPEWGSTHKQYLSFPGVNCAYSRTSWHSCCWTPSRLTFYSSKLEFDFLLFQTPHLQYVLPFPLYSPVHRIFRAVV